MRAAGGDDEDVEYSDNWGDLAACSRCGAPAGQPCTALANAWSGTLRGMPIRKRHHGRKSNRGRGRLPDLAATERRLIEWKRLCAREVPVQDIAETLGMQYGALVQLVYRERRNGNPLAVYHPNAQLKNPKPTRRQTRERYYRQQRREQRG